MNYWARINGKDYPIAYEWTLDEEFSESLDSASILIPHARGLHSLKPYDDVIIHDYGEGNLPPRPYGVEFKPSDGHFYRHMLVESRNIEEVSLDPIDGKKYYNYQISLFSETKGLETVQLPNRTISQPMGTGVNGYKPSSVSFLWGSGNISLPLRVVSKWTDGVWIYKEWSSLSQSYVGISLFAGDADSSTFDYSAFSTMESSAVSGKKFTLPDWNISGISLVRGEIFYLFGIPYRQEVKQTVSVRPRKHWIIRRKGINDSSWNTRNKCITRIKEFLAASAIADADGQRVYGFEEIFNFEAYEDENGTNKNDIRSDDDVALLPVTVTLPSGMTSADYVCYLYVDPVYADDTGIAGYPIPNNPNVFGMTDSSNGVIAPTHESEFLAYWEFSCSLDKTYPAKDVLTVAEAVRQAVEIYSPYVKVTDGEAREDGKIRWQYKRKYSIDPYTMTVFESVIAPENQWNNPNLRDYITRLFYVADCIPVVHDNVIGHIRISERLPMPFHLDDKIRSYAVSSMDGGSYCDRLLREYEDGLSRDNVAICSERIGFKNMDSPTLTLENMELELSHPIYRITKVYMCYYSKVKKNGVDYMRLTKQDITPLVLLNEQRNLLSENWNELENLNRVPSTVNDLAKFKYATIGYSIGDTKLRGWGTKYNHPMALFWDTTKTVLENIFDWFDAHNPSGVVDMVEDFTDVEMENTADATFNSNASDDRNGVEEVDGEYVENEDTVLSYDAIREGSNVVSKFLGKYTQRLKTMVFEVEYQGYISASIIASKDAHDGNVVSRDNASSSLSFVESDGINQKEKVNRLGNENISVSARHKSFADIQNLAQVWDETDDDGNKVHDDEVLFKRSIRFSEGYFTASYYLCKNYVLRNYFTSVFSRHRPFPLASYEQSVQRKENRTLQVLLSSKEWLFQSESKKMAFSYEVGKLFSFFVPSAYDSAGNLVVEDGVDASYYVVYPSETFLYAGQTGIFGCDTQKFVSGDSLCFSVSMKDSVSAGTYVSNFNNNIGAYVLDVIKSTFDTAIGQYETSNDMLQSTHILTGCKQDWFMFPIDPKTGFMYEMSFGVGLSEGNVYGTKGAVPYEAYDIASAQLHPLMDVILKKAQFIVTQVAHHTVINRRTVYFGQRKDGYLVGAGYPHIALVEDSENAGKFKVDLSRVNDTFSYDDCVVEMNRISDFGTYDGKPLPYRNSIKEFVSSRFYGKESPSDEEEKENCVFKDGKERMTVTLQLEPISSEDAIQFSPYMMKLSDAMGGCDKNYTDDTIVNRIRFKYGIARISTKCVYPSGMGGFANALTLFTVPCLTIGVPSSLLPTDIPQRGIAIDKTWSSEPNVSAGYSDSYEIRVVKINGILDSGVLFADCEFRCGSLTTQTVYNVRFFDPNKFGGIAFGRNTDPATATDGQHDQWGFAFDEKSVCLKTGEGFTDYVMCDDGFMGDAYFRYDTLLKNVRPTSVIASSSPMVKTSTTSNLAEPPFPCDECAFSWSSSNFTSATYDYRTDTLNNNRIVELSVSIGSYNRFILEEGPAVQETGSSPRNMYWVLSSSPVDKTSPYECLNKAPANAYSVDEFVPNENIKVVKYGSQYSNLWRIVITMPERIEGEEGASLRLYYKESEMFHFVFGVNLGVPNSEGTKRPNYLYPVDEDALVYEIYLSFVDDRSKTVIDENTGDPSYKVLNFIDADDATKSRPINICIEK